MGAKDEGEDAIMLSVPFSEMLPFVKKQLTQLSIDTLVPPFDEKKRSLCVTGKTVALLKEARSSIAPSLLKIDRCNSCRSAFFSGVFIACGRVNAPNKAYSLELDCRQYTDLTNALSSEIPFSFSRSKRRDKDYLYTKKSENVGDFLTYVGLGDLSMLLANERIMRDMRNAANRVASCESNNIARTVQAAGEQIDLIKWLVESGNIAKLSPELRATAELRLTYSEVSLARLATVSRPPMTKSGLNHRLQKICNFARAMRESIK